VVESLTESGKQVDYLIGHSKGAVSIMLHSALFGTVPNLIAIAPRFNWKNETNQNYSNLVQQIEQSGQGYTEILDGAKAHRITAEMVEERCSLDMEVWARQVQSSVYNIYGEVDEVCLSSVN
jgi:hypothetical protein